MFTNSSENMKCAHKSRSSLISITKSVSTRNAKNLNQKWRKRYTLATIDVLDRQTIYKLAFGRQPFFHLSLKSAGSSFAPERLLATRAITNRRSERRLR